MRLNFVRPWQSITAAVTEEELPDLVVISGLNGAGKSHLLEAIERGDVLVDGNGPGPEWRVRRFVAHQLVPGNDGSQSIGQYRDSWVQFEIGVRNATTYVEQNLANVRHESELFERHLMQALVEQRQANRAVLERLVSRAGKPLSAFEHDDFRKFAPHLSGVQDALTFSATATILAYHDRLNRNRYLRWLKAEGASEIEPLTDEEFQERFGGPPWIALNETAAVLGLDYTFVPPEGLEENLLYELRLRHGETGAVVPPSALSSGEKTLLALTLSLYGGTLISGSIEQPHVLLLDEADASLHPSMIHGLLQVIQEVFVGLHGIRVMLTTHSPTTVALAPDESLYLMERSGEPRLRAASRDTAVASLTAGISTLSVRIENRRLVFVESEHDEEVYQELYRILKSSLGGDVSLEFVASGRGGQGNAIAVEYLVTKLREQGKTTVWGIVDRDARTQAADGVLFNAERYSVENLVLDPMLLAVLLLREEIALPQDLGLPEGTRHLEISSTQAQGVINTLAARIATDRDDRTPVNVAYQSTLTLQIPSFWLNTKGHDLEARIVEAWPALQRFNAALDQRVVSRALGDAPQWTPMSSNHDAPEHPVDELTRAWVADQLELMSTKRE